MSEKQDVLAHRGLILQDTCATLQPCSDCQASSTDSITTEFWVRTTNYIIERIDFVGMRRVQSATVRAVFA